jgi:Zn-dependent protease
MARTKKVRKRISKEKERVLRARDLRDTVIAIAALTIIFAYNAQDPAGTVNSLIPALLAVSVAFLVNRIVCKLLASRLGCVAYYKIWLPGLVFGFLLMLIGFKFPAIGFMTIHPFAFGRWGFKSRRTSMTEDGLMGFVGPASNILLAVVLGAFSDPMLSYMSFVNAYFALFNLLPIKPLSGFKIVVWKPWIWLFLVIINFLIFFV